MEFEVYELHEQILLYLYEYRNTGNLYNLLDKFGNLNRNLLREKVDELYSKGFIHVIPEYYVQVVSLKPKKNRGVTVQTGNRQNKPERILARILTTGVEYVKKEILNQNRQSSNINIGKGSNVNFGTTKSQSVKSSNSQRLISAKKEMSIIKRCSLE
ncbi:MAG TPA: hypothetical protein VGA21_14740 [Cyclobacteriaceae bacterium]|jgi:hypothetical protein